MAQSLEYDELVLIFKKDGEQVFEHTREYTDGPVVMPVNESHQIIFNFTYKPQVSEE